MDRVPTPPIDGELDAALSDAKKGFEKAREAFQAGNETEHEVVSRALGVLALEALQPDITPGKRATIESQQEFLRSKLQETYKTPHT